MSLVTDSRGRARNSLQVHRRARSTLPSIERFQRSSGVRGVGPADSTGKPLSTYCPGGTRPVNSPCGRRPRNPRETNRSVIQATFSRMKCAIRSTPSPLFRFEKLKGRSPRSLVASRSLTRSTGHDPSSDEARRRARLASRYGAIARVAPTPARARSFVSRRASDRRVVVDIAVPSAITGAEPEDFCGNQFLRATPRPAAFAPARLLGARWALGTRTHGDVLVHRCLLERPRSSRCVWRFI